MKVREIGEFGLIEHIARMVGAAGEGVVVGIGDDAACWRSRGGLELATTDSLVEGVHFLPHWATPEELGWKALAVNLSDIAAMGGVPGYALVSLALPGETEVAWVSGLYRGLLEAAREYGVGIVGGDIHAASQIVVTVALWGTLDGEEPMTRSAARPGEALAVTGPLGASAGGLRMLKEGLSLSEGLQSILREAHLRPQPRLQAGQALRALGVRAAIDISDGLLADLGHLCQASRVAARVEAERVPVHPALRGAFREEALGLALSGGEDYELLFSAPTALVDRVRQGLPVTVIGELVAGEAGRVEVVDARGRPIPQGRAGWEHFARGS